MAGIIAKLERCGLDAETFRPLDEAPPIRAASEFSVRDNLKPHALLQRHNITNAFILQLFEFGVADLSVRVLAKCLAQDLWAQQASHMIGAERRTALSGWHATSRLFYRLIDGI
jgi:hypothetical protein